MKMILRRDFVDMAELPLRDNLEADRRVQGREAKSADMAGPTFLRVRREMTVPSEAGYYPGVHLSVSDVAVRGRRQ